MEDPNKFMDEPEEKMNQAIRDWYDKTYTSGLKMGAKYMAIGASSIMKKHLHKNTKATLRDYQRCIEELSKFLDVQLKTQQNENKGENKS